MAVRRSVEKVAGSPEKVASRAAARLAYLGETIEPLAATEFEWRARPAERLLFRSPAWARITCLPSEQPGYTNVVTEWDSRSSSGKWLWPLIGLVGALGLAALLLAPAGWPLWKLLFAVWPLAWSALAGPSLLSGGQLTFLRRILSTGATAVFEDVPTAESYLTLDESARQRVLEALHDAAARSTSTTTGRFGKAVGYGGQDRRSTAELLGWPLWHFATGRDPVTDQIRTARGWYARGQLAQGALAVGQRAQGWVAVGQLAYGLFAVGQAALGLLIGVGQAAFGGLFALGQFGLGLVLLAMIGAGLFCGIMPPVGDQLGVTYGLVGLAASLFLGAGVAIGAKAWLARTQEAEIAQQLETHRLLARQYADAASLSAVERMSDASPERGLSAAELDADA